ncbi:MAG: lipid A export permease/ATP-binding protein MsbA [Gammaproteobacteria bacterium]|nr:lipid A export permease/ATP-binding protein MsbA [Gammaproteobacteria bacterium]
MSEKKLENRKIFNAAFIYKRLFVYVKRYWRALVVAIIASMLYSSVDAWFIYFLKPLLNEGLVAKNHHFLLMAPFIVMGVFLLRGIANFFSNYCIAKASRSVIMLLRQDLFSHLQKLPARFYDHTTTGKMLSILLYGVDQVANASADVLTTAIQSVFLIMGLIIVMFSISWKLTLMYFIIIPVVAIIMRIVSLRIRRLSLSIQDSIGDLSHHTEENIEGYKVVRAFEGQQFEAEKFNKAARINYQREMKVVVSRSIGVSAVQLITVSAMSFTLYIATLDIAESLLTPGGFVSMIGAMLMILKPMKDLAFVQNKLYRGLAGAQSVFEILDEKCEVDEGKIPLIRAQGEISFNNVSFNYDVDKKILHHINFNILPGKVVALVGRSGSGKSTIVSILPRFYDQYEGEIKLDGISLRDYRLKDLRRQFAIVSQNVTLFHDTVYNNIAYGRFGEVTEAEVIAAAKAAYVMEFVDALPQGLQTLIGENGVLLSGGQRQRIAIARAILRNAPILILDEATSALDTESERFIQSALDTLMKNRTTLVIAHRLSTVEHADNIIVLEDGRLIEQGTHADLLRQEGHYAKLYRMQFKDLETISPVEPLAFEAVLTHA